jgi:serine protease inhibitor
VLHKCKLTVDKKGIEGAAVTASDGAGAGDPGSYTNVYHDFVVDRAFGFVLTDSYGTVLFSGAVNTLK